MEFNKSKLIRHEQTPRKINHFEIEVGESRKVRVIEGSIAEGEEESIFLLNLEDDEFPAPGPVFETLLDKDDNLKKEGVKGDSIDALVLKTAQNIKGAKIVEEKDSLSGKKYEKAFFPSSPYAINEIDVTSANWPGLRKLFFGNIGSEDEGVLVRVWQPIAEQVPKIKQEITTLLENLFNEVKKKGIKSVAMPILTGNRAPSKIFYQTLSEVIKNKNLPVDLTIYAYRSEDFEEGRRILQK